MSRRSGTFAHIAGIALVVGAALAIAAPAALAEKKGRKVDLIRVHPDFAAFGIQSIAMLPPVAYDRNLETESQADAAWGAALRGTGYRWIGGVAARTLLGSRPGGDSLLQLARTRLLDLGRVDSLLAPGLCQRLRADAVLTLRVDRWEKLEMEFNQAGKPSTTVQLRAALVDSTGALLWSASGSETAEGPYHDPSSGVLGVKSSGLGTTPVTGQGGAPSYREVLDALFARWTQQFPARAAPAPAPAAAP